MTSEGPPCEFCKHTKMIHGTIGGKPAVVCHNCGATGLLMAPPKKWVWREPEEPEEEVAV